MKNNIAYLRYLIRHKYFVFLAGRKAGVSLVRLLIHDWSKFTFREWIAYREYFYGTRTEAVTEAFNRAWLHHIHWNKHHFQHWVLIEDPSSDEQIKALKMPEKYVREMVADWYGAGRAIFGKWGAAEWYQERKDKIIIHPDTRVLVECLIGMTMEQVL
jgi:DNA-binding transcriptional MocR family regulator